MLSPEEKRSLQSYEGLAPVVYVQSSCDCPSRRDELVKALARHIRVDSYGACLNNKTMPSRIKKNRVMSERENLLTLLGKYKFVLALENAECEDYITEKLWNALEVRKLLPQLLFAVVAISFFSCCFATATAFFYYCCCCSYNCSCCCHCSSSRSLLLLLLHYLLLLVLLLLQHSSFCCCFCIFCCCCCCWGSSFCYCYSLSFRLCSISASFGCCVCYCYSNVF